MKIESTIRRKAGSSQTIDGVTYHWNEANGHVCEVENPEHAQMLLAHPEGWRAVGQAAKAKDEQGAAGDGKASAPATRKGAAKAKDEQGG